MAIQGRKYQSSNRYRYGFNGKENDPETVGTGSGTQDYGFRIYNPSLGKFLSVDPLANSYPYLSPYAFAENDVIRSIDLDGLEKNIVVQTENEAGQITKIKITTFHKNGIKQDNKITGTNGSIITDKPIIEIRVKEDGTVISTEGKEDFTPDQNKVNTKPQETKTTPLDIKKAGDKDKSKFAENGVKGDEHLKGDTRDEKVLKTEKTSTYDHTPDAVEWIRRINDEGETIDTDHGGTTPYIAPATPDTPPEDEH